MRKKPLSSHAENIYCLTPTHFLSITGVIFRALYCYVIGIIQLLQSSLCYGKVSDNLCLSFRRQGAGFTWQACLIHNTPFSRVRASSLQCNCHPKLNWHWTTWSECHPTITSYFNGDKTDGIATCPREGVCFLLNNGGQSAKSPDKFRLHCHHHNYHQQVCYYSH